MERRTFLKKSVPMAGVMMFPFSLSVREKKWEFLRTESNIYSQSSRKIRYLAYHYESPCKRFKLAVAQHLKLDKVSASETDYRCVHVESTDSEEGYGIFWGWKISSRDGSTQVIPNPVNVQIFDYPDAPEVMMRRVREDKRYAEEKAWLNVVWGRPGNIGGVTRNGRAVLCRQYHKCLINGDFRGLYYKCV